MAASDEGSPRPGAFAGQLVLAPGMLSDSAVWAAQIEGLSDVADCLTPEYGRARSMAGMAAAVLDQAAPRFSLAGHSMGGRVALEVCRLAPERVLRLCLAGTEHLAAPAGEAGVREAEGRRALLATARERGMRAVAEQWLPHLVPPERLEDEALVGPLLDMIARQTPEQLEAQIVAGETRPDSTSVVRALQVPVLILGGMEDRIRPPAAQRALAALLPSANLRLFPGCGHMVTMERAQDVVLAMRAWLASPPDGGAGRG